MTDPAVSIVLPTFNRLTFLRPAVESVFAQTFTDWELIIADDGSEPETVAYLRTLENPPQVKVLRLAHTGNPAAVRNAAWRESRGKYVAFLDSDDIWLPQKLALQVASLGAHPQRGWSHTAFALIDSSGKLLTGGSARSWAAVEGRILERVITMEVTISIASVMVRRELLAKLGGFDLQQRACNDYDLYLRLAAVSEVDGIRETLLHKRSHVETYYQSAMVFEDLRLALGKLLAANTDRSVTSILRRERAKMAAGLARAQAVCGDRGAAVRTLAESSRYSWAYPEWWRAGARTAAHVMAPASVLRIARLLGGRSGGV